MKPKTGHLEVIEVFRRNKLKVIDDLTFELTGADMFNRLERVQIDLALMGYEYAAQVFKHARLPKISFVTEPDIKFVLSK